MEKVSSFLFSTKTGTHEHHFLKHTKHLYFRCKRLKLTLTINCTKNYIKCVRTLENGQIERNIKKRNINEHYFSIFFHTNPLLFFVLPLTQAYIPLYGMPVASEASLVESYSATNSPSNVNCAIGELL